jgi:hypothetical protein
MEEKREEEDERMGAEVNTHTFLSSTPPVLVVI